LFRNQIINFGWRDGTEIDIREGTGGKRIEKNGDGLLRRPKLALSCSAEGKEGRKEGRKEGCAPLFRPSSWTGVINIVCENLSIVRR
jgi:hypothetical protein